MCDHPFRYSPAVEDIQPDQREMIDKSDEQFLAVQAITTEHCCHGVRAVRAKGHGVARGTLTVRDGLPPELAQCLYARPGRYDAIVRIST